MTDQTLIDTLANSPSAVLALILYFHLFVRPWLKQHVALRDELDKERNKLLTEIRDTGSGVGRINGATTKAG